MTFPQIRDEYERQRELERVSLAGYLSAHDGIRAAGLSVVTTANAGKGRADYTAQGRIPAFDLRNWKWVRITGADGFDCVVSLNMLDIDPTSKNIHSLYDRIGLIVSPAPSDWFCTDIDLPLDDIDKEQIAQLVLTRFEADHSHRSKATNNPG